jgi:hypothetical protein
MQYTSQNARFSRCKAYRYSLSRSWSGGSGKALFIGLNPSTADKRQDDPTIRRCVGFAAAWGCNSMEIVNLFAFRATRPEDLKLAAEPIGRYNDRWITAAVKEARLCIACWGDHGVFLGRANKIRSRFAHLQCLGINASGMPKHPLYTRATQTPFAYRR